jgi:hypothetical protein
LPSIHYIVQRGKGKEKGKGKETERKGNDQITKKNETFVI